MRMHDSGRNLWPQDFALTPPITPPNPLRFEALILINSGTKRTESPLKLDIFPRLIALQIKPANENNSGQPHNSTATCRSSQLNGSHTWSTHPNTHKRLMPRHTVTDLQTTTPTQMVGSHGLTERIDQYAI